MIKRLLLLLSMVLVLSAVVVAQEVDVDHYSITARADTATGTLSSQATIELSNPTDTSKSKLYFKLTRLGKVEQVTVNGSPAENETTQDHRSQALNQIAVTLPTPLPPGGHISVTISYHVQVVDATPLISIYPGEVILLPESVWFPSPSTPFAIYGPNTAPYTLTLSVNSGSSGFTAASAGTTQSGGSGPDTFTEPLNSIPLAVAGDFGPPIASEHAGIKIALYLQPGITRSTGDQGPGDSSADGARAASGSSTGDQSARITAEVGRIVDFFTKLFGPPPAGATFSCISSVHAGNSSTAGALILNEQIFREDFLDSATIGLLADAISRIWTDGRVRIRGIDSRSSEPDRPALKGRSAALLRDSIPRYLAVLYLGERFGQQAATDAFGRMRAAYTPVAQAHRDSEISVQTFLLPSYGDAVFEKGPLVLRMLAHTIGEDKLLAAIRAMTSGPQTKIVTLEDFHAALGQSLEVDSWFKEWVDAMVEPDIIIGIPIQGSKPDTQVVNLRNLGTGDVSIAVLAVTASGKKLTGQCAVPSDGFSLVEIPTTEKIVSVEADPEKFVVQTNYDNDSRPVRKSAATLLNEAIAAFNNKKLDEPDADHEAIVAFNKKKLDEAETDLTDAIKQEPNEDLLHAWLGRVLLAEGKIDQADREAEAAIKTVPPLASALTWAHITMGQIALARNSPGSAVDDLRRAVLETTEEPAEFAAREALIKAEKASGKLQQPDPSVRAFISQFDAMVRQPTSDKVFEMVMKSTLKRFGDSLVLHPAQAWRTEILRAERIDSRRVALDVSLQIKSDNKDQSGTAVFVLYRANSSWMLENVRLFNVKEPEGEESGPGRGTL
jgi:tetratricopeptide (TPR) repeat protein